MFSVADRSGVRATLVAWAEADPRIVGAALVGSAARGAQDQWSDIDLALQLAGDVDEGAVVEDWTHAIGDLGDLADTIDLFAGGVRYRVFLLQSSLQIDVSFWPNSQFRATGPGFEILFGEPNDPDVPGPVKVGDTIGMSWLYAIHARSAVARGRFWQASMMLDELRTTLIALKCVRAGLDPGHREVDQLPPAELAELETSRAQIVTADALEESRRLLTRQLLAEIALHDSERWERLRAPLEELARAVR